MRSLRSSATILAVALPALGLVACGGGGGGGGGSPATAAAPATPAATSALRGAGTLTALSGSGVETGTYTPGTGLTTNSSSNNASLNVAADGSRTLTLPSGGSAALTATAAPNADGSQAYTGTVSGQSGSSVTLNSYSSASNLTYSDYGNWAVSTTSSPTVSLGIYAVGLPTTQMPTTGSASYTGGTTGVASLGGTAYNYTGNTSLTANFAQGGGTISGTLTNLQATPMGSGSTIGMNNIALGQGNIIGTNFVGPASSSFNQGALNGNYGGSFYGPGAREAAGTYRLTGSNGDAVAGAFGAHQ